MRVHEKMANKTNPNLNSEIKIWKWVQFGVSEPENTLVLLPVCSAFCWTFRLSSRKRKKESSQCQTNLVKCRRFLSSWRGKRPLSAEARLADALRSLFSCRQKDWVTSALRVNTCDLSVMSFYTCLQYDVWITSGNPHISNAAWIWITGHWTCVFV